jgi:hypothetical protein
MADFSAPDIPDPPEAVGVDATTAVGAGAELWPAVLDAEGEVAANAVIELAMIAVTAKRATNLRFIYGSPFSSIFGDQLLNTYIPVYHTLIFYMIKGC